MKKKKVIQEPCVAVRLSSSNHGYVPGTRYLNWIDNCWYETGCTLMSIFPVSQIPVIKKQLAKHFQYFAAFINPDGSEEVWSAFAKKQVATKKKLNGFSFVLKTGKL